MNSSIHYNSPNCINVLTNELLNYLTYNTIIVCIGTDKCIGDCLGPLVGTILKDHNSPIPVYGTLSDPIHALNINKSLDYIHSLHPNSILLGIDACLGNINDIGEIRIRNYAIHPGKGVGKLLPEVGTHSIIGIVDSSENSELFFSRSIRLSLIMEMAKVISTSIITAYNQKYSDI